MPEDIVGLLRKHRQPAILVHRPFPPLGLPKLNSRLGGSPSLPPGRAWPRGKDGVPLHFLAQIDCSELPPNDGLLPDTGFLFFFARVDEDMYWAEDPKDACRVLFTPDRGETEIPPPDDLPSIMGDTSDWERFLALPGDPPANIYPSWPVTLHSIDSWPDQSAIPGYYDKDLKAYFPAVWQARAAEIVRVLGLPLSTGAQPPWGNEAYGAEGRRVTLPGPLPEKTFPQVWIMVERIVRALLNQIGKGRRAQLSGGPKLKPDAIASIEAPALRWLELARREGLENASASELATLFAGWLTSISQTSPVATAVRVGMKSALQAAAASPRIAALIPPLYFNQVEPEHFSAHASKSGALVACNPWRIDAHYHQMLGNAPSSQQARPVEREEALLLQLVSDRGVDFMFCDAGEAAFWIRKEHLAARRFEETFATTCGG